MTICIGALAQIPAPLSPCAVLCFDTKVANEAFGSESEYKFYSLNNQFVVLVAGRPGRAKELVTIYREHLKSIQPTVATILEDLRGPLATIKERLANAYINRKLAFSYQDLLDHGEAWIGKDKTDKYLTDIEANFIGVDMIFAGFIGDEPIICALRDEEIDITTNFSVIGTGMHSAEPALHARRQTRHTPLSETLYNLYEAKKMAESSPYVGSSTRMLIIHPANADSSQHIRAQVVTPEGHKFLEKLFKKYGPKPMTRWPLIPDDALQTAFFNFDEGY